MKATGVIRIQVLNQENFNYIDLQMKSEHFHLMQLEVFGLQLLFAFKTWF